MPLTATNALVSVSLNGGGFVPQANGAVLTVAPSVLLAFALQSTALIQNWSLQLQDLDDPLLNTPLSWNAGQFNSLPFQLGPQPRRLAYISTVSDGSSGIASISGQVQAIFTGAAFTTTGGFTQPAVGATVNAPVATSTWMAVGQVLVVGPTGGSYLVTAIPDGLHVTLQNLGYTGNAAPTSAIPNGSNVACGGLQGQIGNQGTPGAGTTMPVATEVSSSGTVGAGRWIRENIDMSAASQITRTMQAAPSAGDVYEVAFINAGTTAQIQPVIFASGALKQDPENAGLSNAFTTNAVKYAIPGSSLCWQWSATWGWVLIRQGLSAQVNT